MLKVLDTTTETEETPATPTLDDLAREGARPSELLRCLGRPLRRAVRPRRRRAAAGRPVHRRPGSQHPAHPRRHAGGRRAERLGRLLAADGPVRRHLRPPLQPVHAVGPERRALLRTVELHLGSVGANAMAWHPWDEKHTDSLEDFRYTFIIGEGLRARSPAGQGSEVVLGCEILNRMTALGRPVSYRIGR